MRKKNIKKIVLITLSATVFLLAVLCVHIYVMMKPGKPGYKTIAMARIDFKQNINQADANKISTWLYSQAGVQHVLCNEKTDIAVFSFYPAKTNADILTNSLSSSFGYKAIRYMPDEKDMLKGCPVANKSFSYKVYSIMKNIL